MRTIFLLSFLTLAACSSNKYVGTSNPVIAHHACSIEQEKCSIRYGTIDINYTLESLGNNEYLIEGAAEWSNPKLSAVYTEVQQMGLTFAFLEDGTVIHQDKAWVRGQKGKDMPFTLAFSTEKSFDSSIMIEYRGSYSE